MGKEIRSLKVVWTSARDVNDDELEAVVGSAVETAVEQLYNDADHLFACAPTVT